jgi:hypothetical protein
MTITILRRQLAIAGGWPVGLTRIPSSQSLAIWPLPLSPVRVHACDWGGAATTPRLCIVSPRCTLAHPPSPPHELQVLSLRFRKVQQFSATTPRPAQQWSLPLMRAVRGTRRWPLAARVRSPPTHASTPPIPLPVHSLFRPTHAALLTSAHHQRTCTLFTSRWRGRVAPVPLVRCPRAPIPATLGGGGPAAVWPARLPRPPSGGCDRALAAPEVWEAEGRI